MSAACIVSLLAASVSLALWFADWPLCSGVAAGFALGEAVKAYWLWQGVL